ncbi:O-antigen polymerase [Thermotoga sp. RQ7]|uniref:O-antigen polymerase n=1 Tax=Thermotoga sp. RQ7 TaxID=126738 RepID=UPI00143C898F|nr:O-antigen polymerase [Thermotoga sp. RQ7]
MEGRVLRSSTLIQGYQNDTNSLILRRTSASFPFISFILFVLINILVILFVPVDNFPVLLSSILNLLLITVFVFVHFKNSPYSISNATILGFFYSFFWLAPYIQLTNRRFPNTMPFDDELIILTNLVITLFIFAYCFTRFLLKDYRIVPFSSHHLNIEPSTIFLKAIFLISILISFLLLPMVIKLFVNREWLIEKQSLSLIVRNFLFSIPTFPIFYLSTYKSYFARKLGAIKYNMLLIISIFMLLLFANPITGKRNLIGPIYLSVLFLWLRSKKWLLHSFFIIVIVLTVLFPLTKSFTHSSLTIGSFSKAFLRMESYNIYKELQGLDFDAWSMLMAGIDYIRKYEITYGRQILGVLLFWIPRSQWTNKPVGSGHLVAEKLLMKQYAMWFTNLSFPLPAEGLINFGLIGVIMFAIFLGVVSRYLDTLQNTEGYLRTLSIFTAFYLIYVLRGDLMSSFAYYVGRILGMYVVPLTIKKIMRAILYDYIAR